MLAHVVLGGEGGILAYLVLNLGRHFLARGVGLALECTQDLVLGVGRPLHVLDAACLDLAHGLLGGLLAKIEVPIEVLHRHAGRLGVVEQRRIGAHPLLVADGLVAGQHAVEH